MLTSRGTGMLVASVLTYAAARSFGIAELQLVAVAVLVLTVLAWIGTTATSRRVEVLRTVRPTALHHDAEATLTLHVHNRGRLPTAALEVRDAVPAALGSGVRARLGSLAAGERVERTTTLTGRVRGHHRLAPVTVTRRDPFGLVRAQRPVPADAEVVVYPRVVDLPSGLPLGGATTATGGGAPRPLAIGEERSTVREYVRGDDLRAVHWASTAHRGKLMVRQAEAPQDPRATVVLDVRADRHDPAGAPGTFETAVAVAASVAFHLDRRGRGVVLLDGPLGTAGPRPRPAEAWLTDLATIAPHAADVGALWRQLGEGRAGDGALVVVAPPPTVTELHLLVRAGRAFGTRTAVLIDAHPRGPRAGGGAAPGDVDAAVAGLRAAGWRATAVRTIDELPIAWYELTVDRPGGIRATARDAAPAAHAPAGRARELR